MTGLVVNVLFDALIALLLVLTIAYCWVLNRRIRVLQDSRSELAQLIKHFDESTERASNSIVALQSASKKIGEAIQERVEKANFMADDLAFLIEKASKSADQLEAGLAAHRAHRRQSTEEGAQQRRPAPRSLHQAARETAREFAPAAVPKPPEPVTPPQPVRAHASATPKETLSAIRGATAPASVEASVKARTHASLEAVLERMANRNDNHAAGEEASAASRLTPARPRPPAPNKQEVEAEAARPRSRAEQELLDIIKAGSRV